MSNFKIAKQMKKAILSLVLLLTVFLSSSAQIATQNSTFFDNTYIGVSGQVATPLSGNDVFPVDPAATLFIGKDITPVFGLRVEGTAWFGSNTDKIHAYQIPARFDNPYLTSTDYSHNAVRGINVGLDGTVNLSNWVLGYKGTPRPVELSAVTGLGWFRTLRANETDLNDLSAKTGLSIAFNLGKDKAHTILVEPAVLWNLTKDNHQIKMNKHKAYLALSIGYAYHFKTSNGTHSFKTYDVGAMNDEINRLLAENEKLGNDLKAAQNRPMPKPTHAHAQTKVVPIETTYLVTFAQNDATLTDEAKATLDNIPGFATVNILATASPEGTADYNKTLSEKRANAVSEYLKSKNITVNEVTGAGVTGNTSNRIAIVTVTSPQK